MSLPKYPEYKDSGVSWLGDVPVHWSINPIKRNFMVVGGSTPKSDVPAYWDGDIVWVSPADLSRLSSNYVNNSARRITQLGLESCGTTLVPPGSIVLSTRAPIGSLGIADVELCTNQGCKSLVPVAGVKSQFTAYVLLSATTQLNLRGKGTTFLELSSDELGAFPIPKPPLSEQAAIEVFLDRETAKIDALIAEQEKLIALLAEKRQATISRAVTRGLDPNVPLKDSGVPWLGKVPMHWDIVALKRICDVRDGTHDTPNFIDPSEDTYPLITTKDLSEERVCFDEAKHISSADFLSISRRSGVEFGDVIMPMIGSVGGAVFVDSQKKFAIKNIALFKKGEKFISEWLRLVLNSNVSNVQFDLLRSGGVQGFVGLGGLRNLIVPYPCRDEQIAIVNFLEEKLSEIDLLDAAARNATLLLTERRAALISAAVTGKIDVRGLAA